MKPRSRVDVNASKLNVTHKLVPSQQRVRSRAVPVDTWAVSGQNGIWVRSHHANRRTLETPCKINDGPNNVNELSCLRLTCGTFDNGVKCSHIDSWKNRGDAHRELNRPWSGVSVFFEFGCSDMDASAYRICSIMDNNKSRKVQLSNNVDTIGITPYAEMHKCHPHYIIATHNGWKDAPSRADPFTGKSHLVMRERRSKSRRSRIKAFRRKRRAIMEVANDQLRLMEGIEQSIITDAPMLVDQINFHEHVLANDNDLAIHRDSSSFGGPRPDLALRSDKHFWPDNYSLDVSVGARKQGRQQEGAILYASEKRAAGRKMMVLFRWMSMNAVPAVCRSQTFQCMLLALCLSTRISAESVWALKRQRSLNLRNTLMVRCHWLRLLCIALSAPDATT